jgi:hypothetical protein
MEENNKFGLVALVFGVIALIVASSAFFMSITGDSDTSSLEGSIAAGDLINSNRITSTETTLNKKISDSEASLLKKISSSSGDCDCDVDEDDFEDLEVDRVGAQDDIDDAESDISSLKSYRSCIDSAYNGTEMNYTLFASCA